MPSGPSPVPRRCSPISAGTRTVSRSPTAGWSRSPAAQVGFRWRDYRHHDKSKVMTLDGRRVYPPLPAAHAARWVSPHPPLRFPRQPPSRRQARALPQTSGRAGPRPGPRSHRMSRARHRLLPLLRRADGAGRRRAADGGGELLNRSRHLMNAGEPCPFISDVLPRRRDAAGRLPIRRCATLDASLSRLFVAIFKRRAPRDPAASSPTAATRSPAPGSTEIRSTLSR